MVCYLWFYVGGVGGADNDQNRRIMGLHDGALSISWPTPSTLAMLAFWMDDGEEKKVVLDHNKNDADLWKNESC